MLTRAEQRRQRQLEIEKEQRLEDDEALKMTEVRNPVVCPSMAVDRPINRSSAKRCWGHSALLNSSFTI